MNCRKSCNNFPTCRFSEEGSRKDHCNFYIEIEGTETTNSISSTEFAGSATEIVKIITSRLKDLTTDIENAAAVKSFITAHNLRERKRELLMLLSTIEV